LPAPLGYRACGALARRLLAITPAFPLPMQCSLIHGESGGWTLAHRTKGVALEKVETLEETLKNSIPSEQEAEEPSVLEDICVEELAIDGICGVY